MFPFPVKPRSALLDWCRVHDPIFFDHWDRLGLHKAQAQGFRAAVGAAAAAALAQRRVQQAARVSTRDLDRAFAELAAAAGEVVRSIRAFAATAPDPAAVHSLAQVPPVARPSPLPPPGRPHALAATLDPASGAVTLRWKSKNPRNARRTTYLIRRRLPGETEFTFLGVSGRKRFVDETMAVGARAAGEALPPAQAGRAPAPAGGPAPADHAPESPKAAAGSPAPAPAPAPAPPAPRHSPGAVQYTVQGRRADRVGPVSLPCTVKFGRTRVQWPTPPARTRRRPAVGTKRSAVNPRRRAGTDRPRAAAAEQTPSPAGPPPAPDPCPTPSSPCTTSPPTPSAPP